MPVYPVQSRLSSPLVAALALAGGPVEVPATTPSEFSSPERFTHAVYGEAIAQGLPPAGAELLTAHVALSTGWGKAAHNYILAGIKAGAKSVCYGGTPPNMNYVCLCTFEYTASGAAAAGCSDCSPKNGVPRCKYPFKAYGSLSEGVAAILATMQASRYTASRAYLLAGNPEYFRQLGKDGWYTANPDTTYASMLKYLAQVRKYLGQPVAAGFPLVGVLLGGGLGWLLWKKFGR